MLALVCRKHSVVGASTCEGYGKDTVRKFHEIPIVNANSRERKDVVQFARNTRSLSVMNEGFPFGGVRRERQLIVDTFRPAYEALVM
jgi:hypothetical protein